MENTRYFTNTSPGQSGLLSDWATLGWLEEGLSECGKRQNQRGQWKETRTAYSFWGRLVLVLK